MEKKKATFTKGSKEMLQAVKHLDKFMYKWCIDYTSTEKNGETMFRCNICEFRMRDFCIVKMFKCNKAPESTGKSERK